MRTEIAIISALALVLSVPVAFGEIVETKGQNYDLVENFFIGEATWTSHPERIMDGGWQNYALSNTGDKVIFNTNAVGSFIFDKNSCSYSIYGNGFDGEQIIPSVSAVATYLNDGQWQNLPINDEACTVTVDRYEDGVYLTSTKVITEDIIEDVFIPYTGTTENFYVNATNANFDLVQSSNGTNIGYYNGETITTTGIEKSKFSQEIRLDINSGFKETFKVWHDGDEQLGISQTVHTGESITIGDQTINIAELNGQSFDRQFIIDNEAEILELTDSINYDFDTGIESLSNVNIIFDGDYKVNMDFSEGNFVGYLEIDPTITTLSGTTKSTYGGSNGAYSGSNSNGYVGGDGNLIYRSGFYWDISSISDSATITNTELQWNTSYANGVSNLTCDVNPISGTLSTDGGSTIHADVASGTPFIDNGSFCAVGVSNGNTLDLGSSADSDLESHLSTDEWGIGIVQQPLNTNSLRLMNFLNVELQVTYSVPVAPQPPTGLTTVTGVPIELDWTAPTDNGDSPITGYKVFRTLNEYAYSELPDNSANSAGIDFTNNEFLTHGFESTTTADQSLEFDGSSDYVQLPQLATGNIFAVSAWVKVDVVGTHGILTDNAVSNGIYLTDGASGLRVGNTLSGGTDFNTNTHIPADGNFHHVVWNVNSPHEIWLDGTSLGTGGGAPINANFEPRMGFRSGGGMLDGVLDEVGVWDRNLSTSEVASLYAGASPSTISSGLVAYYDMETVTSSTISDVTSNNYDGTNNGAVAIDTSVTTTTIPDKSTNNISITTNSGTSTTGVIDTGVQNPNLSFTDSNLPDNTDDFSVGSWVKLDMGRDSTLDGTNNGATTGVTGKIGNAWSFDGSNDYVQLGTTTSDFNLMHEPNGQWSGNFWYKTSSLSNAPVIFDNTNSQTGSGMMIQLQSDGKIKVGLHNAGSQWDARTSAGVAQADGNWHMVTITMDLTLSSNNLKIYHDNGTPTQITKSGSQSSGDAGSIMKLGSYSGGSAYYNGLLDQVIIYDKVLSSSEISALYNSGSGTSTPNTNGMVAHYNFEQTGTTLESQVYVLPTNTKLLGLNDVTFHVGTDSASVDEYSITTTGITWDSSQNLGFSISGNTITKTASTMWQNNYVRSTDSFTVGNGLIIIEIENVNGNVHAGFNKGSVGYHYGGSPLNPNDFAMYIQPSSWSYIYENGASVQALTQYAPTTNVYKITIDNSGVVRYYTNDILDYTSSNTATGTYYIDIHAHDNNSSTTLNKVDITDNTIISATGLTDNTSTPQHYTFTRSGNDWTIYQNGASEATATDTTSLGANAGSSGFNDDFTGYSSNIGDGNYPSSNTAKYYIDTTNDSWNTENISRQNSVEGQSRSLGITLDDNWTFKFSHTTDGASFSGSGSVAKALVLSDSDHTVKFGSSTNDIGFYTYYTPSPNFGLREYSSGSANTVYLANPPSTGTTHYFEIIKSGSTVTLNQYSDSNYSTLIESINLTTSATGQTYLKNVIGFTTSSSVGSGDIDSSIDDITLTQSSIAYYTTHIDGMIDEYFINSDALTSTEVDMAYEKGSEPTQIATTGTTPSYDDSSVTGGTEYYYTVKATNAIGDSDLLTPLVSALAGTPPDVPTSVSSTINSPNTAPLDITVSWSAPTNVGTGTLTGFEIYRDSVLITTTGLVTSYTDTVPSGGGTFEYKLKAVSTHGASGFSATTSTTTPTVPPAPTNAPALAINNPNPSPLDIEVSWTEPASGGSIIQSYEIFRSADDVTYTSVGTVTDLDFTDTVPSAGTWYYKFTSINLVGSSGLSPSNSITTASVPSSPLNASSVIPSINSAPYDVTVSWDLPTSTGGSALTGYNVYRQTGTGAFSLITTTTALGYVDTVPTALNQDYTFKIHAVNNVGESTGFTTTTITTGDVPDAPTLSFTTGTTALSWTVPNSDASITGYEIFRDGSSLTTVTTTSHSDFTPINFGQSYQYEVQAVSSLGNSASSNSIVTTPETEITGMIVQGITGTGAVIDWEEPAYYQGQITSYSVYYSTPAQSANPTISAGTTTNTYSNFAPTLDYDTGYTFGVTINSPLGNSGFSNLVNATTNVDSSIVAYDPNTGGMNWFDIDSVSEQTVNVIEFQRETQNLNINGTFTDVDTLQVGYPSWWDDMTCDIDYKFAQKTEQYVEGTDMTAVVNSADANQQVIGFQFQDIDNEVIEVECAPQQSQQDDGVSAKYIMTQTDLSTGVPNIPLVTQIQAFQTGDYGTDGDFGALDIVGLFVILISMVGFNRLNPIVGVLLSASLVFGLSFFGIISLPTVLVGVVALVIFLAWGITRNR